MTYEVDALVIGAGVVGLACARHLAAAGLDTIILESERQFGQGISSRNSEVIHAGLYYAPGSLKAKLCRQGMNMLYAYCGSRAVPCRKVGKWVVASNASQLDELDTIAARARQNGCDDISILDGGAAVKLESQLRCTAALESPSTGIVDSHALMMALLADFEREGGALAVCSQVTAGAVSGNAIGLCVNDDKDITIRANYVVNAAGLNAPLVAAVIDGISPDLVPKRCFAKGSYVTLTGSSPFSRLIYPIPETGGLGVHLTLDLHGQAKFGPNVEWIDQPEYSLDPQIASRFHAAIVSYWPTCNLSRLQPGYAGVRPKLGTRENFVDDFVIQSADTHGVAGLVNLFGIESPGLTSCMAIAQEVAARLGIF